MLAIRMQRTGRKGHAQFRVIVQDAHRTPTSGRIVAALGHYDPHSKAVTLDKEKASFFLEHGAQPSGRVAVLLKNEGVKLPKWVELPEGKKRSIRNTDKLRRNRPAEPVVATEPKVEPAEVTEEPAAATPEAAAEAPEAKAPEAEAKTEA